MPDEEELQWLDEEVANEEAARVEAQIDGADRLALLEAELQQSRKELSEIRKELAAKVRR
jgi:hypothetical protein